MHPFERWPERRRGRWLLALALVYAVVQIAIALANRPLSTEAAPDGIVTLELAGSPEEAAPIVEEWARVGALDEAGISLGLDFLYMPLYGALLAGLVIAVAQRAGKERWGRLVAWAPFVAVAFDVVETVALTRVVDNPSAGGWAALARVCALPKFGLLAVAFLFVVMVGATSLVSRPGRET